MTDLSADLPTLPASAGTVLIAGWIRGVPDDATVNLIFDTSGALSFRATVAGGNTFWNFQANDSASAAIVATYYFLTPGIDLSDTDWHSFALSVDVSSQTLQLVVDTEYFSVPATWSSTNDIGFFPGFDLWYIGQGVADPFYMSDFRFSVGEFFFDLSDPINIHKFFTVDNTPVDWGGSGEVPTGSIPDVFLDGTAADYADNRGSGATFTVTGALDDTAELCEGALPPAPPPPPPPPATLAAVFNGTNWLTRGGNLTGVSDSPFGTFSVWINSDYIPLGLNMYLLTSLPDVIFELFIGGSSGAPSVDLSATSFTSTVAYRAPSPLSPGVWTHVLFSWDTNHGIGSRITQIAINGILQSETITGDFGPAFSVGYTADADLDCFSDGSSQFLGKCYDFWFAPGVFLDLTNPANIAKFISGGSPVELGANGEMPTGSSPAVYLHIDGGGGGNDFVTNRGTGGGFTLVGNALSTADPPP